ncbi:MAG TPA: hypothetical protein VN905_01445 [Candidatus Binatia bacterium]|nr:hypothetical protein [Candidatus Binatia bacterium]
MWQLVRKNFGLKVLALVIAILAWVYVRFAGNPVLTGHFDQQVTGPPHRPAPTASGSPQ